MLPEDIIVFIVGEPIPRYLVEADLRPERLDISFASKWLQDLQRPGRTLVPLINAQSRENIMALIKEGSANDEITNHLIDLINLPVAQPEKSRIIYYNFGSERIESTPITEGEFASVGSSLMEVLRQGHYPLIEAHTHVTDSLPSKVDFYPLLMGNPAQQVRLCQSIVVLGKDYQIMGLPSMKTPVFATQEDLDQHLLMWDNSNEVDLQSEILKNKIAKMIETGEFGELSAVLSGHLNAIGRIVDSTTPNFIDSNGFVLFIGRNFRNLVRMPKLLLRKFVEK